MSKASTVERAYESLFICPVETPQKTIDSFIEKIKTAIQPSKGILRGVQIWGRRRLTYPIKHHRDGLFIFLDYTGESKTNEALKNLFHVNDFILRHMISDKVVLKPPYVRKSPGSPEASAVPAAPSTNAVPATLASPTPAAKTPEAPSKELPSA